MKALWQFGTSSWLLHTLPSNVLLQIKTFSSQAHGKEHFNSITKGVLWVKSLFASTLVNHFIVLPNQSKREIFSKKIGPVIECLLCQHTNRLDERMVLCTVPDEKIRIRWAASLPSAFLASHEKDSMTPPHQTQYLTWIGCSNYQLYFLTS